MPGKVLARILLDRVRRKLLTHQRHEQSGFTPTKSTADRILALRVLTARLRDFRTRLSAAYVDLRKDSPRCTAENPGIPWNIPKARQPIWPVFWYSVLFAVKAPFLTTSQVILGCIMDVFLPRHSSKIAWTTYWGGCKKVGLWCVVRNSH